MKFIMYALLVMTLLVLLWMLRSRYRMHQEQAVLTVYSKWNYVLGAAFLLLGIISLFDEERFLYGIVMTLVSIFYVMRKSGITQHDLYVEGRRIPLQAGKVVVLNEKDGYLQLYYELGIHNGTMKFSLDEKEQLLEIMKACGY